MAQLNREAITAIHAAAVRCRFASDSWRAQLFDGIDALAAKITRPPEPKAATLADLTWLNQHPEITGINGPPLAVWLRNAAQTSGHQPEAAVFRAHRQTLLAQPDGTPGPEPFGARPWPLLRPYTDPRLFAGRDADVQALAQHILGGPHIFTGLHAPSGFGKSSMLAAGLLPHLRAQGVLAAWVTEPQRPPVGAKLLQQLGLPIDPLPADDAPDGWLAACAGLPEPPVLVLDQFEELFKTDDPAPRARIALMLAAVARWATTKGVVPARVVLSYREEYHGRVQRWLEAEIGAALGERRSDYPTALGAPRFAGARLPPLRTDGFLEAIEKPLTVHPGGYRFADDGAQRLAAAFAAARIADPGAPLVPELQVVLGRLVDASADGVLQVPPGVDALIAGALGDHLRARVDAFTDDQLTRTRVWLGLRRLVSPTGACAPAPLAQADLVATLPALALRSLSEPDARILIAQSDPDAAAPRWRLSHDALAATVHAMTPAESGVDAALFEAEALIAQRSGLFAQQPKGTAHLGVAGRIRRRIAAHPWLVDTDARRGWWAAVRRHVVRTRVGIVAIGLALAVTAIGIGWSVQRGRDAALVRDAFTVLRDAQPDDGASVLQAVATVRALAPDHPDMPSLIAEKRPFAAALAVTTTDLEDDRAWLIKALITHAKSARDFGYLVAGTELARDLETPGRWSETRYRAVRAELHAALVSKYGKPPTDLDWRPVPAGSFTMGSDERKGEGPRHTVVISKTFEMLRYEVRRGDVATFEPVRDDSVDWLKADLRKIKADGVELSQLPAWGYDWYEANALAAWLDPLGRLPSEAEWEYAARGGPKPPSGWTDAPIDDRAWHKGNSGQRTGGAEVHPVCELQDNTGKPQHPLDLCDVLGNLWEWVADRHTHGQRYPSDEQAADPMALRRGALRGLRGGSFLSGAAVARAAVRNGYAPSVRVPSFGVRVVRPAPIEAGP